MGNCLVIQDRDEEIKIMRMDGGEILKLQQQDASLAGFATTRGGIDSGDHDAVQPPSTAASVAANTPGAVVQVKLVISKQQLKKMLHKDGISLDDMVALMQREASEQEMINCRGWRPALQSIPEGSDC
uniref:Uncharacterized protein n=1 Tax=Leersia perrieri TaxID=77586 RepID=A0A0D9XP56_9ORYZ